MRQLFAISSKKNSPSTFARVLAALGVVAVSMTGALTGPNTAHASLTFVNRTTANGLGVNTVRAIFADGQNVYAATSSGGVGYGLSISTDGGQTFVTRTTADGLGSNTIDGIWASGSTVYAATGNGVSVSIDGGQTFTNNTLGGGSNANIKSVAQNGQNVYVATVAGLNVSSDGGQTFALRNSSAFGGASSDAFVTDLHIVGSDVYVAVYYLNSFSAPGGIFKSTDGGATFTATGAPSANYVTIFVDGSNIYTTDSSNVLRVSNDGGSTFTQLNLPGASPNNVWASGSTVYVSSDLGVHESTDGGQNFTLYTSADGLGADATYGGVTSNGSAVFAGTTAGVSIGFGPAPTVSSVSPTSGTSAGGTSITITGANYVGGATVTVGGNACTNVNVVSSTSITCVTPAGTAGTASVVVTSGGQSNASNTLFTFVAPPTTTVAPTTTTTTTTIAGGSTTPTLVTSANQAALTAALGKATALINGVAVAPEIVAPSNSSAAQVDPANRTPAQIRELQQAATAIESRLDAVAGGDSGVSVVRTDTGAVMTGIFSGTRVPVEDVVVVNAANTATLFAARDVRGNVVEVQPGAVLEVASNGDVAVQAFGLTPNESVELVVMSTPTLLGKFSVDSKGSVKTTAKLPATIGSGNHSLVVASPSVKASLGLKLVKSTATLPVTGSESQVLSNWAVAILLSGAYLTLIGRTRRRAL